MLSARFIACSNRYTSFSRSTRRSLGEDANNFRACFNVSLNVASSNMCLSARNSYDFEKISAENSPAMAKNRGSRETFFQQLVSIYFILRNIGLTTLGTSTTVRLLDTGLLDVTSIGLRTLFVRSKLKHSWTHAFLLVLLAISFLGLILHSTLSFPLPFTSSVIRSASRSLSEPLFVSESDAGSALAWVNARFALSNAPRGRSLRSEYIISYSTSSVVLVV